MVIQHNLTAMNSNRQLNLTTGLKAKSSEKLSSGYKINRAADDAAGLAISEKMRRQIRGLSQATENVQDGISYVQVADGALAEIDEMLARMNQLCIQAATDTLTEEDRIAIDMEIQKLKVECNRTFRTTKFNDRLIWDEDTTETKPVGKEWRTMTSASNSLPSPELNEVNRGALPTSEYIDFDLDPNDPKKMTATWTGYNGITYTSNPIPIPGEQDYLDGFTFQLSDYMDYTKYPAATGIDAKLNVTFDPMTTYEQYKSQMDNMSIEVDANFGVSGTVIDANGNPLNMTISGTLDSRNWVESPITYYGALITRDSIQGVDDDHIKPNGSTVAAQNATQDDNGNITLKFTVNKSSKTDPFTPDASGKDSFSATAKSAAKVYTRSYDSTNANAEGIWWEYNSDHYPRELHQTMTGDLHTAIENAMKGVRADKKDSLKDNGTINKEIVLEFNITPDENNLKYTGVIPATSETAEQTKKGSALTTIGKFYVHIPVTDQDTDATMKAKVDSIKGIDIASSSPNYITVGGYGSSYEFDVMGGTMRLNIQAGADNTSGDLIPLVYDVLNNFTLGISDLDTLTMKTAKQGLGLVKNAATKVDEQRGVFGAYQNRMEHTVRNLGNVVENVTNAESIIRDTDMAAEMVRNSNLNILAKAGESIMAQANQTNQGVMALLQ